MSNERPLFSAGVVGSMPRPQFVRDLLDPEKEPSDPEVFAKRMDAAVDYIVALQEAAGLDIVSDGEYRRRSYIGIIADVADGFLRERKNGLWWHTVVEPMRVARPGIAAGEARYLKARTDRQIKVCLPSAYLLGQRMWDPDRSREAYPTREAFMEALVPILRGELELLREAGADIVQFDDPHLCLFVDERVRTRLRIRTERRICAWTCSTGLWTASTGSPGRFTCAGGTRGAPGGWGREATSRFCRRSSGCAWIST